ncbi:glycosyltransferase N-terminal domain-containing protein [Paracoccus sanguinis]|uniref:glycosyltransferase N-terminal domain-containing protein n=1 Tax=Paracoccus sanguinis TaxID=1545044 RepID=UPI0006917565|nr:glycosyltransferase N-terminal domain-containing protein [Paracoccus sanguinis]
MIYRSISGLVGAALRPLARGVARERLALDLPDLPRGAIWVHGASVGELNSARPVVAALAAVRPVVVSANSDTGLAVARGWGLPALRAPLDVPQAVGRFLDALQPSLAVTIENELWPNRAAALTARGIPQALIGARMSARSARSWQAQRP